MAPLKRIGSRHQRGRARGRSAVVGCSVTPEQNPAPAFASAAPDTALTPRAAAGQERHIAEVR